MKEVIVVGAGLGGLAAAAYLARGGRRVHVFERASAPGGRARTERRDGFSLNQGAHAVYLGGPAAEAYRELGVSYTAGSPPAAGLAIHGGRLHALPTGVFSLLFGDLLPVAARLEAARFFAQIGRVDAPPGTSLRTWAEGHLVDPRLRELFFALARLTTYAHAPDLQDAKSALAQLRLGLAGVAYVDGGWATLVDGLRAAAEQAGARLELGRAVVEIVHDDRVRGVRLDDGAEIAAAEVVLCAGPRVARALTRSAALAGARLVPARAACLDVALTGLPRPRASFALGIDAPIYLAVHSAVAALAPPGGAVVHVARYLAPDDDGACAERELEGALDLVQPGWRALVAHRRFLPDMTVAHALAASRDRPPGAVPDVAGLHLVGDWVGARGELADAVLASARAAAGALTARRAAA